MAGLAASMACQGQLDCSVTLSDCQKKDGPRHDPIFASQGCDGPASKVESQDHDAVTRIRRIDRRSVIPGKGISNFERAKPYATENDGGGVAARRLPLCLRSRIVAAERLAARRARFRKKQKGGF
jgi:hypothetical protein